MKLIEELIAKDVYQPEGHRYLAEAACALGLKKLKGLPELVIVAPKSVEDAKNLIRLYIDLGLSQDVAGGGSCAKSARYG